MPPLITFAVCARIFLRPVGEVNTTQRAIVADIFQRSHNCITVGRTRFINRLGDHTDGVISFQGITFHTGFTSLCLVVIGHLECSLVIHGLWHTDPSHKCHIPIRHVLPPGLALQPGLVSVKHHIHGTDASISCLLCIVITRFTREQNDHIVGVSSLDPFHDAGKILSANIYTKGHTVDAF